MDDFNVVLSVTTKIYFFYETALNITKFIERKPIAKAVPAIYQGILW